MALTVAQAPLKLMWHHRTSCVLPTSHRVRLPIHQGSRSKVHIRVTSGAVGGCEWPPQMSTSESLEAVHVTYMA